VNASDPAPNRDHPSFVAAGSTVAAYLLVLLGMAAVLFGVPFVLFSLV
jgi:hypothetical protein